MKKELFGLVLSGGQSRRMGRDKGSIVYHDYSDLDQRSRCYELLGLFCKKVYISYRNDQESLLKPEQSRIPDLDFFMDPASDLPVRPKGPALGILSAHLTCPESSWLILACDLPFVEERTLDFLTKQRKPLLAATAFRYANPNNCEPLLTIWENRALVRLKQRVVQGDYSPRRALESFEPFERHFLIPPNPQILLNVNTPYDFIETPKS